MQNRRIEITPSILAADFRKLEREVKDVEQAGADRIHCDVMDGAFVPNISFGPLVVEAVKKCVGVPLDVHLMITEPIRYVEAFCSAGADTLTVHAEACSDLPAALEAIRKNGVRVGVTVNPDVAVDRFMPYLRSVDQVLIMTVYAGFGGQRLIPGMLDKIQTVYAETVRTGHTADIQVDGGVNRESAMLCARHGANVFVAGSYIFGAPNYRERIESIRSGAMQGSALLHRQPPAA